MNDLFVNNLANVHSKIEMNKLRLMISSKNIYRRLNPIFVNNTFLNWYFIGQSLLTRNTLV